jgi:hypothetical protein
MLYKLDCERNTYKMSKRGRESNEPSTDMRERYERTLEAYDDHFLEPPPEWIWPPDFLEPGPLR